MSESNRSNSLRLLVFAPSRRRASETFIRANLQGLPCQLVVFCGDEWPPGLPSLRHAYAIAIFISKILFRLRLYRVGTWLPSRVAISICRAMRPDAVLVEFGFHAVRVMDLVPATGLPLFVHFRGADASAHRYLHRLSERYRRLLQLCAGVIVKSQPMAERLLALAGQRQASLPMLVSPSGADASLFHSAQPGECPACLISVGRFVAKKGPLLTLRAFARAASSRPDLRLVMVGDGPLLSMAIQTASKLGIASMVSFPGVEPPQRIAQRLRQCRAFVQHSLTAADGDQEGAPVAVIEAQLSGLPVVATRHAGIPEVVLDGQTGFLVAEGDVAAMADAIGRLADEPALAARLGAAGRERMLERFTVAHHLDALMGFIQSALETWSADSVHP